jgi:hypothetical protein
MQMTSSGLTCGIDWAEAHHDVALVDENGNAVAKKRVTADLPGFTELLELIAEHGGSPEQTPVAIETDKTLFVVALAAAGFTVFPVNPKALARYRERHGQSGAKSDPADAATLANVLRTDRHVHRTLPAISDQGLTVKALARQHQEAIWGAAPDHQQAARGAIGVPSPGDQGVPEATTPRCHHDPGRSADAGRWSATHSAPDRSAVAPLRATQ